MSTLAIKTPEVFAPLWTKHARFKGAWGGRGGGKSHDRAQDMIRRMMEEPGVRCACIREVQNSIKDSVLQLMADWIRRLGLGSQFRVLETEIRCRNGSVCIFKGMKDQNADSIKSMEGVKYCWWEEAQTASEKSLRLLRPTIRVPGSEIWFTWNPNKRTDPVDQLLRSGTLTEEEAVVVEAQFSDNPYFTDELEQERRIDERGDEDNYLHVWLGAYQSDADMQFISDKLVRAARSREAYTDLTDVLVLGVDVARFGDDRSVILTRRGMDARSEPLIELEKVDTMTLAGRVKDRAEALHADAVFVDEGGVGAGVVDRLRQLGMDYVFGVNFGGKADRVIPGNPKATNKRAEMWATMREAIRSGLALPDTDRISVDLTGPLYSYDSKNAVVLEKKADMKKRGLRSPDIADALALTFAYPVTARRVMEAAEPVATIEDYDPWG